MLVDDDTEFLDVACTIIECLGHEVLTATNLEEAKDWLAKETFDHILLDFMLPDGSGLHLLESLPENASTHVTLITGHPSVKGVIKDLCGPKVDYLVKPIQRKDIEQALSRKTKTASASARKKPGFTKHFGHLIGESACMQELYKLVEQAMSEKLPEQPCNSGECNTDAIETAPASQDKQTESTQLPTRFFTLVIQGGIGNAAPDGAVWVSR